MNYADMSGADEKIRAVLERVAREACEELFSTTIENKRTADEIVATALERHLLPLLLAGQAMREQMHKDLNDGAEWSAVVLENRWDAALAATQGQSEKESGR